MRLNSEALLLRIVDFGESDRIVSLLTPGAGKVTAIAKGARRSVKRFPGSLDLFNHLRVQVERRRRSSMARIDQAILLDPFLALRGDPRRFALACYLVELLDRLAPEGGARSDLQRLFSFALSALRSVAAHPPKPALRVLLELRALDALGLRPELSRCVRCGQAVGGEGPTGFPVGFHVGEGGVVCAACALGMDSLQRIHLGTLRALEQGLAFELDRLDRIVLSGQALAEAQQVLERFHRFHIGMELRSERFLDRALNAPERRPPRAP